MSKHIINITNLEDRPISIKVRGVALPLGSICERVRIPPGATYTVSDPDSPYEHITGQRVAANNFPAPLVLDNPPDDPTDQADEPQRQPQWNSIRDGWYPGPSIDQADEPIRIDAPPPR